MASRRRPSTKKPKKPPPRFVDLRGDPEIERLIAFASGPARVDADARDVLHDMFLERYGSEYSTIVDMAAEEYARTAHSETARGAGPSEPRYIFVEVNRILQYEHLRLPRTVMTPWGAGRGRFASSPFHWTYGELPFVLGKSDVLVATIPPSRLTTEDVRQIAIGDRVTIHGRTGTVVGVHHGRNEARVAFDKPYRDDAGDWWDELWFAFSWLQRIG